MRVDVVALLYILQNIFVVGLHAFAFQLVIAALGTYLSTGGDEDFQFSIEEDDGADIATVHHDADVVAHLLLLRHHSLAHEG